MSPVATTRAWLREVVVGLDLCPFARRPLEAGEVRFAVTSATSPTEAVEDLLREAETLLDGSDETTLLIAPTIGLEFEDFTALTWAAEALLEDDERFASEIQIVPFHPGFRFQDSNPGDPANRVNRSPHPTWHLLRAESVEAAIAAHPDAEAIPERNAALLRSRG